MSRRLHLLAISLTALITLIIVLSVVFPHISTESEQHPVSRKLLTCEMYSLSDSEFVSHDDKLSLNDHNPTEYLAYHNDEYQIYVSLPFNDNWGSSRYSIHPFENIDDCYNRDGLATIAFGPLLSAGTGNAVERFDTLSFRDHGDATYDTDIDNCDVSFRILKSNGLHAEERVCQNVYLSMLQLIVSGRQFDYIFTVKYPWGWRNMKYLEEIAGTIRLSGQ